MRLVNLAFAMIHWSPCCTHLLWPRTISSSRRLKLRTFKGAPCCLWGRHFKSEEKAFHGLILLLCLDKQTLICFLDWINKPTLRKDNTVSCCLTLFTCGGPCHLSSFKQCSGDLTPLGEQLVHSDLEKLNISEFVLPSDFFIFIILTVFL